MSRAYCASSIVFANTFAWLNGMSNSPGARSLRPRKTYPPSSLGETTDRLPLDLRLGVSKALRYIPLTISVMGYNLDSYSGEGSVLDEALRHVAVGGELRFGEPVRVRLGYNPRVHEELATGERLDLAGLSAGFGLEISRFGFDYAFNSWSQVGGLHQLSVRTRL